MCSTFGFELARKIQFARHHALQHEPLGALLATLSGLEIIGLRLPSE
jgi:hypothetical protein